MESTGEIVITYTGRYVWPERGSPSLFDIGVALARIPRWAGHTKTLYSVASHSYVVAKLLPPELEVDGWLHDAPEAIVTDMPQPWKTDAHRRSERLLIRRIYRELGLKMPSRADKKIIKHADTQALHAEAWLLGHAEPDWFCNEDEVDETAMLLTKAALLREPLCVLDPKINGEYFSTMVSKSLIQRIEELDCTASV